MSHPSHKKRIVVATTIRENTVFETLIFRWREALRESSGNFEELQELFEIVVKFRDPQVKPRLQKIIERSPKFSELLSSDRIADALIQGNLLKGIVNWSGAADSFSFLSFLKLKKIAKFCKIFFIF